MSSKVFSDAMIRDMLAMREDGNTAAETAEYLNKKYKVHLKTQAIFDKLGSLRRQGIDAEVADDQPAEAPTGMSADEVASSRRR